MGSSEFAPRVHAAAPHATPWRTTVPGYPRVGRAREYKRLLEGFWSGRVPPDEFRHAFGALHGERLRTQAEHGLDLVPCGDFSMYDHVLDAAVMLGCVPPRFGPADDVDISRYYAMARGQGGVAPLEMTKWFDTNYHYLVPELPNEFVASPQRVTEAFATGLEVVGSRAKPTLLGPFTFLKLARLTDHHLADRLPELTPIYASILRDLGQMGAHMIQLDEPALVGDVSVTEIDAFTHCYESLGRAHPMVVIQTYYGDVAGFIDLLSTLPVGGIGLDFVRGREANLAAVRAARAIGTKTIVAGLVDGRNIWPTPLDDAYALAHALGDLVGPRRVIIGASCPLWHLPESTRAERGLPPQLSGVLRFAQERLDELSLLARALRHGIDSIADEWRDAGDERLAWLQDPGRHRPGVQARVASLGDADATRIPYGERVTAQQAALGLPLLPTTTIGSFPQTPELRRARAAASFDASAAPAYHALVRAEIGRVVAMQEELGLDVLVHGEPERSDMVEYFAARLGGCTVLAEGWVQSYGSRCVRPPVVFGDVERITPLTVDEARYAQSLTERPVKGMLTGPVTMLQWSFVRDDVPREVVAYQLAIAVRDEVVSLEREARLRVIQIDEPAIREGLPLRRNEWAHYLAWATRAFRVAASGAAPSTQIHTHMCYSEFADIVDAIVALDADVLSIEDARSDGANLRTLRDHRYSHQVGPGVYDIHSPNVPDEERIVSKLRATLEALPAEQVWVNPDCGLKTRSYAEVVPALRNLVAATRVVRAALDTHISATA
jgi:5-methyltetrahydropteroyltriglutamate--homocysteine methyltransferase